MSDRMQRRGIGVVATRLLSLWLGVALLRPALPAHSAGASPEAAQEPRSTAPARVEADGPTPGREYLVRPGDVLHVVVWKEPDFTGDLTVRPDGKITVSLVGDVDAWGLSPRQIAMAIEKNLERYIEDPHVTVGVVQPNSARFFVIGQAAKTGAFPLVGQMTFVQALASVGGFSTFAKKKKVFIVRYIPNQPGAKGKQQIIRVDYNKLNDGDPSQNIILEPGDTIVIP